MGKKSERTLRMIDGFMELHRQGYTISDIAEYFQLTPRSVYQNLDTVAEKYGVSRKSLLKVVQAEHRPCRYRREPLKAVDPQEFNQHCDAALSEVRNLRKMVECVVEECKEESHGYGN